MENTITVQWPGWKTVRLIGRGSFGAVYEIERDLFGKKERAALKHIRIPQNESDVKELLSDGYDDESISATFQSHLQSIVAEYSLMRKLNGHSNVVNCDDVQYVQREDGIGWDIYIKMELVKPITDALPFDVPEETVIKAASDLCRALVLCQKYNIIHRDIKPQNIFVSDNGDYKLGDFGIAKTVEKTMGGTKTGTYKYMAPEVYYSKPYGQQADIYSLGLVLYWMLNKRRMPFTPLPPQKLTAGIDEKARSRRLSGEQIPPPLHGSEALKAIVLKACAYETKDRYLVAEEMLADLEALQYGASKQKADADTAALEFDDEGTVGAFRQRPAEPSFTKTVNTAAEAEVERGTIGVFASQGAASSAQEPEEEGTVGVFKAEKRQSPIQPEKKQTEYQQAEKTPQEILKEKKQQAQRAATNSATATSAMPQGSAAGQNGTAASFDRAQTGASPEPLPQNTPVPKKRFSVFTFFFWLFCFVLSVALMVGVHPAFSILMVVLLFSCKAFCFPADVPMTLKRDKEAVNCTWAESPKSQKWLLAVNGKWVAAGVKSPFRLPQVPPNATITLAYQSNTKICCADRKRIK